MVEVPSNSKLPIIMHGTSRRHEPEQIRQHLFGVSERVQPRFFSLRVSLSSLPLSLSFTQVFNFAR